MKLSTTLASALALAFLLNGCSGPEETAPPTPVPYFVDVKAVGLQFEAPSEIPSGWTTFRFKNDSVMTHFALVERMPEGIGIEEQQRQAAPVFQAGMDLLSAGKEDEAMAKFGELPEWFGNVVFLGGPGLLAPGHEAEETVFLEPGTYLLECYVKTNGVFHSNPPSPESYGMVHQFVVTDEDNGAPEPQESLKIALSSTDGIDVSGEPIAGRQTVAVQFVDQKVYENFVGHDVHLVRLKDDTDLGALAEWMDWRRPTGLSTPAPVEFLGGTNEMPADGRAYFTVTLEPGRYAWISEVPDPASKGMLVEFQVP